MIPNNFAVYIMTNQRNTVLYIGRTKNLKQRTRQHKGLYKGFTAKYNINKLIYFEDCQSLEVSVKRERQLKNLVRRKKIALIKTTNPELKDLFETLV